jgi:hypothetical protein
VLVVSLPGEGNQSSRHPASYTDTNNSVPWSSLVLEPEIYGGAPRVGELVYSSYSFGLIL